MSLTTACRSLPVPAGKKVKFHAIGDVRITNAALGEDIADEKARSTIKLTYENIAPADIDDVEEDEEEELKAEKVTTVLCALTPGKVRVHAPIA